MEEHSSYQESADYPSVGSPSRCTVALVHFGSAVTTRRCVESLRHEEGPNQPIVIADHGPDLPLATQLGGPSDLQYLTILPRENLGFGAGCNAAAVEAFASGARWVWFLNNDATLESPVLSRLTALAASYPQVGIWGTHQRDGDRLLGADRLPSWFPTPVCTSERIQDLPPGCRQLEARETLSGASILISREAWDQLGCWPEWCFLYWEDTAWCLKAHQLGIPIVITDLEITHPRNTTTGHHSPLTTYYGVRNGLLLHGELWPTKRFQRFRQSFHLIQKRFFQGKWPLLSPTLRGILDARNGVRFRNL